MTLLALLLFVSHDSLALLVGAATAVLCAYIETRRAPVDEHLRIQTEDLRERMVKLEQKYLAYPTAQSMLEQFAENKAMYNEIVSRMVKFEQDAAHLIQVVSEGRQNEK